MVAVGWEQAVVVVVVVDPWEGVDVELKRVDHGRAEKGLNSG